MVKYFYNSKRKKLKTIKALKKYLSKTLNKMNKIKTIIKILVFRLVLQNTTNEVVMK